MKGRILWLLLTIVGTISVKAISFDLDSIASWGKFPRFCVNTYRWGDKFFNGYDTVYVDGTGYKWNTKVRTETWTDRYDLHFENGTDMSMISNPSTSIGLHLQYLALSVGYDKNISRYFNGGEEAKRRWVFGFNCMLFNASLYFIQNNTGSHINSFKPYGKNGYNPDLVYKGIDNTSWGLDISYYFSHKHYSHAAAFAFSRVQKRSAGSFFAGFSYGRVEYDFDLNGLPEDMAEAIPNDIPNNHYILKTHNYILSGGYGYNWVFARHWVLGATGQLMYGLSDGYYIDTTTKKLSFTALARSELSVVWNNKHWFAGAIFNARVGMARDHKRSILSSVFNLEMSVGYRFNLW